MALTPLDKERRGRAARDLLNSPAFANVMAEMERDAFDAFVGSGLMETKEREIAYLRTVAIRQVRSMLENWVREGKTE